jgi:hypothetical protein
MWRSLLIRVRLVVGNLQAFDLSASYLAKLLFPALARLGDKEQDQTVPGLTEPIVFSTHPHVTRISLPAFF